MDQKRYMVHNTTRKAARIDPKTGQDVRSVRDKVGHNISFRNEDDMSTVVTPGKFAITARINEGLMNLQRSGDCAIKEIKDITEAMAAHALTPEQNSRATRPTAGPAPQTPADVASQRTLFPEDSNKSEHGVSRERQPAKAVAMGEDKHEQRGGREHGEAVNPDGEPNFLVKTKEISRQRRGGKGAQAGV